jgi:hypothetical protein
MKTINVIMVSTLAVLIGSAALAQQPQPEPLLSHEATCKALATATFASLHSDCRNLAIRTLEGSTIEGCVAMAIVIRNRNAYRFNPRTADQPSLVMPPERIVEQMRVLCTDFIKTAPLQNEATQPTSIDREAHDRRVRCLTAGGRGTCY